MGDRRVKMQQAGSLAQANSLNRRRRRPSSSGSDHPNPQTGNVLLPSKRLLEPGGALAELKTIRRLLEGAEKEYDSTVKVQVARAYQIAFVYERNQEAYLEFCRATKWKGSKPSPERPDEAIRFVVRRLVRKDDPKKKAKTVFLYVSALSELRECGVRPADVITTIENTENGLSGLSAAWSARKRAIREASPPPQDDKAGGDGDKLTVSTKPAKLGKNKKTVPNKSRVQIPVAVRFKSTCYIPYKNEQSGMFFFELPDNKMAVLFSRKPE